MKKLIGVFLFAAVIGSVSNLFAGDFCTDFGIGSLCLPIASGVDGAFGYDFKGHRSQGLGETKVGSVKVTSTSQLVLKAGGITTENGKGAPFLGFDYEIKGIENPIPGITTIHPGVYGGHDFHTNEWFYGLKASIPVFN